MNLLRNRSLAVLAVKTGEIEVKVYEGILCQDLQTLQEGVQHTKECIPHIDNINIKHPHIKSRSYFQT